LQISAKERTSEYPFFNEKKYEQLSAKIKVLKPAPDAGFRAMILGKTIVQNVLPMFSKKKNPRNPLICKGFRYINVGPPGLSE